MISTPSSKSSAVSFLSSDCSSPSCSSFSPPILPTTTSSIASSSSSVTNSIRAEQAMTEAGDDTHSLPTTAQARSLSPPSHSLLFPLDRHPSYWISCPTGDRIAQRWSSLDEQSLYLQELSSESKLKLAKSIGFCPHTRHQVATDTTGTVGNTHVVTHNTDLPSSDGTGEGTSPHLEHGSKCRPGQCVSKAVVLLEPTPLVDAATNESPPYAITDSGSSSANTSTPILSATSCCFDPHSGMFDTEQLLGVSNKSQAKNRPLYRQSRVILHSEPDSENDRKDDGTVSSRTDGSDSGIDERMNERQARKKRQIEKMKELSSSFIDASYLHPQIIITQCPMSETLNDVHKMIRQQNISLWISLTPISQIALGDREKVKQYKNVNESLNESVTDSGTVDGPETLSHGHIHDDSIKNCYLASHGLKQVISSSVSTLSPSIIDDGTMTSAPTTSGEDSTHHHYLRSSGRGDRGGAGEGENDRDTDAVEYSTVEVLSQKSKNQKMEFIWFKEWEDFSVPTIDHDQDIHHIVQHAVQVIQSGGVIAINCLGGRGRSGTLASIILAVLNNVDTHNGLVDTIVRMRERRDNIVEMPIQYHYAARVIGLKMIQQRETKGDTPVEIDNSMNSIRDKLSTSNLISPTIGSIGSISGRDDINDGLEYHMMYSMFVVIVVLTIMLWGYCWKYRGNSYESSNKRRNY